MQRYYTSSKGFPEENISNQRQNIKLGLEFERLKSNMTEHISNEYRFDNQTNHNFNDQNYNVSSNNRNTQENNYSKRSEIDFKNTLKNGYSIPNYLIRGESQKENNYDRNEMQTDRLDMETSRKSNSQSESESESESESRSGSDNENSEEEEESDKEEEEESDKEGSDENKIESENEQNEDEDEEIITNYKTVKMERMPKKMNEFRLENVSKVRDTMSRLELMTRMQSVGVRQGSALAPYINHPFIDKDILLQDPEFQNTLQINLKLRKQIKETIQTVKVNIK